MKVYDIKLTSRISGNVYNNTLCAACWDKEKRHYVSKDSDWHIEQEESYKNNATCNECTGIRPTSRGWQRE